MATGYLHENHLYSINLPPGPWQTPGDAKAAT